MNIAERQEIEMNAKKGNILKMLTTAAIMNTCKTRSLCLVFVFEF